MTEIFDPVDGFAYFLDEQHKIAHRMAMQPPQPEPLAANAGAVLPQTTTEKLGTQTIEGVLAEGTRTTITAERNGHPAAFDPGYVGFAGAGGDRTEQKQQRVHY